MLVDQLDRAVPGFAAAREDYLGALTEDERRRLDALQRDVLGPLRRLRPVKETVVRILVDGLDQVPSAGEVSIREALGELAAGPGLDHVRLICTARPDTDVPGGSHVLRVDKADDALLGAYLTRRGVARACMPRSSRGPGVVGWWRPSWPTWPSPRRARPPTHSRRVWARSTPSISVAPVPRRPTGGGGSYGPSWGSWRPPVSGRSCPCRCCAPPPAGWAGPTVPTGSATSWSTSGAWSCVTAPGPTTSNVGLFHQTLADYLLDSA